MNKGNYVFTQLMDVVSRYEFNKCVRRYDGHVRVRKLSCWSQFLCMSFGQLTYRQSLRDIVTCLASRPRYHLGFRHSVARSTLSEANTNRSWQIYADLATVLMRQARQLYANDEPSVEFTELQASIYALDASLIRLCLQAFFWAEYRKTTAGVKIHTLLDVQTALPQYFYISYGLTHDLAALKLLSIEAGAFYLMDRGYMSFGQLYRIHQAKAYFIIRAKSSLNFRRQYSKTRQAKQGIMADQIGVLQVAASRKAYGHGEKLRRIKVKDLKTNKPIVLLTNHFELDATLVAELYRQRWKIELFFKWVKQHLQIKVFWGRSENAVKTQLFIALCTYLIVAIVRKQLHIQQSMYQMLQILSVCMFEKVPVNQLFMENNLQKSDTDLHNQLSL